MLILVMFVRIENYWVDMKSTYFSEKIYEKTERLQISFSQRQVETPIYPKLEKQVSLENENPSLKIKLSQKDELKLRIIKLIFEKMTGMKVRLIVLELADKEDPETKPVEEAKINVNAIQSFQNSFGLIYSKSETYTEQEKLSFETKAFVSTTDGRKIEFSLNFQLSRLFSFSENFELRLGDAAKDPLVLNFDGSSVQFSDKTVKLDVTLDGILDEFRFVSRNSGFLVIDLNDNNVVDDGRELFGPTTGDGFKELAEYDLDKNQWIDEADPIFYKLKIWSLDENGQLKLFSLSEKNVGAIYLGFARTRFELYDSENFLGRLQKTGVFLTEDAKPGVIQQIDLRV